MIVHISFSTLSALTPLLQTARKRKTPIDRLHVIGADLVDEPFFVDEDTVETRTFPRTEELAQRRKFGLVGMAEVGDRKGEGEHLHFALLVHLDAARPVLDGFDRLDRRDGAGVGDGTEMFFGLREDFGRLDIARDEKNRIRGLVIGLVKIFDVFEAPRLDVVHEADRRPMVGVVHVSGIEQPEIQIPHRVVVGAPAPFFGDDVAFRLELVVFEVEVLHQFGEKGQRLGKVI